MEKIDIQLLKQLRAETLAPMKDCKKALIKTDWDIEKAKQVLKEMWAMKAAEKSERDTNEWIVRVKKLNDKIACIKLACETDFVAKNIQFVGAADEILNNILENNIIIENIKNIDNKILDEIINPKLNEIVSILWENIKLVDIMVLQWNYYIYEHPGNKIVWLIWYKSWDNQSGEQIAKELAIQIVAMNPSYISTKQVPDDFKIENRKKFSDELKDSKKPTEIINKIVDWKMQKIYEETVLLEQVWIRDWSKRVKDLINNEFEVNNMLRYSI